MFRRYSIVESEDLARGLELVTARKETSTGASVVGLPREEGSREPGTAVGTAMHKTTAGVR